MSAYNSEISKESFSPEHVSLEKRFGGGEAGSESRDGKKKESAMEKNNERENGTYKKILSKVKEDGGSDHGVLMSDASILDQQADRESQITHLVDLAMSNGVEYAVKVAQKAQDYYILDTLHDRLLADDLHDALAAKGLIKE
jgi:hypothetical protein